MKTNYRPHNGLDEMIRRNGVAQYPRHAKTLRSRLTGGWFYDGTPERLKELRRMDALRNGEEYEE